MDAFWSDLKCCPWAHKNGARKGFRAFHGHRSVCVAFYAYAVTSVKHKQVFPFLDLSLKENERKKMFHG